MGSRRAGATLVTLFGSCTSTYPRGDVSTQVDISSLTIRHTARTNMGSVIKKRRKRMAKKKHRKLLRKTRHQRRNKK